jgi:putative spermidine/putrescine transport system permease protein
LYYSVFAAGIRASQSVDAMAVVYMATTLVWLLIALRFVNPTQLVTRVKEPTQFFAAIKPKFRNLNRRFRRFHRF